SSNEQVGYAVTIHVTHSNGGRVRCAGGELCRVGERPIASPEVHRHVPPGRGQHYIGFPVPVQIRNRNAEERVTGLNQVAAPRQLPSASRGENRESTILVPI